MKKFIHQMEPWIGKEEEKAIISYLKSGAWLTEFKKTEEFEKSIADYVGSKYVSVVSNGTVSLYTSLIALGIGKGDEVLVPDFTMIASGNAVLMTGASAVLVDVESDTLCMNLSQAEKLITKKTKAMIYVSLNGRSSDMDHVLKFCKKHHLSLIEDAAQSLGSYWKKKHLGTFGDIGSLSFSAPKVITTGQGGALLTDDKKLYEKIEKIKDFGRIRSGVDQHVELGFNFKFTDILAVLGIEQMKKLPFRVKRKKEIFKCYRDMLFNLHEVQFIKTDLSITAPWFIDVLVERRSELISYLKEKSIGTRPFYPPLHTQFPYNKLIDYKRTSFNVSTEASDKGLWLPSSAFLSDKDISIICKCIKEFYKK